MESSLLVWGAVGCGDDCLNACFVCKTLMVSVLDCRLLSAGCNILILALYLYYLFLIYLSILFVYTKGRNWNWNWN